MIYLASPYTHYERKVVQKRYEQTVDATAFLLKQGLPIFSPIVHNHALSLRFQIPTDAAYWERYNTAFLRKADALYVLKLKDWRESVGVQSEIKFAVTLDLPISYVDEHGEILV